MLKTSRKSNKRKRLISRSTEYYEERLIEKNVIPYLDLPSKYIVINSSPKYKMIAPLGLASPCVLTPRCFDPGL